MGLRLDIVQPELCHIRTSELQAGCFLSIKLNFFNSKKGNNDIYIMALLRRNEVILKKCVTQLLAHRRYLMNAIFLLHQELKTEISWGAGVFHYFSITCQGCLPHCCYVIKTEGHIYLSTQRHVLQLRYHFFLVMHWWFTVCRWISEYFTVVRCIWSSEGLLMKIGFFA